MQLIHHHITITLRDGKHVRVIYLDSKAGRWCNDHAVVHITTFDWLEPDRYRAIYHTAKQSYAGYFVVLSLATYHFCFEQHTGVKITLTHGVFRR